jgi:hypothetical protein
VLTLIVLLGSSGVLFPIPLKERTMKRLRMRTGAIWMLAGLVAWCVVGVEAEARLRDWRPLRRAKGFATKVIRMPLRVVDRAGVMAFGERERGDRVRCEGCEAGR